MPQDDDDDLLFKRVFFLAVPPSMWHHFIKIGWLSMKDWMTMCQHLPKREAILRRRLVNSVPVQGGLLPGSDDVYLSETQTIEQVAEAFGGEIID